MTAPKRTRWFPRLIKRAQARCSVCQDWGPSLGYMPTLWAWHDPKTDRLLCPECAGSAPVRGTTGG